MDFEIIKAYTETEQYTGNSFPIYTGSERYEFRYHREIGFEAFALAVAEWVDLSFLNTPDGHVYWPYADGFIKIYIFLKYFADIKIPLFRDQEQHIDMDVADQLFRFSHTKAAKTIMSQRIQVLEDIERLAREMIMIEEKNSTEFSRIAGQEFRKLVKIVDEYYGKHEEEILQLVTDVVDKMNT